MAEPASQTPPQTRAIPASGRAIPASGRTIEDADRASDVPGGENAVHTVQAYAEAALADEALEAARWSPGASFAAIAGASGGLWALIAVLVL